MGAKDDKISTIVLKVDLECQRCYKKIRRVLCKIQDKMNIKTISYDEKSKSVTISGPFDAEEVRRKLCCQAGRVIKEMHIMGKESKADGGEKAAAKPAEKDAAKAIRHADLRPLLEKIKAATARPGAPCGEPIKGAGKAEKDGKAEKKEAKAEKEAKPDKEKAKDDKPEKKVKFADGDAKPAADTKPTAIPEVKVVAAKAWSEAPCGELIKPPVAAAQGVAVPSIWPAPAGSVFGYSYNPSQEPSYYGGGYGYGYGGCGCGYASEYCRCGKALAPGGYYGVPVYDNQGWYYGGGRQPYYAQQQPCSEDPNAGCSVM